MSRSRLSDFEMLSRLGSGSFGTVFKVRRLVDEHIYVVKTVRIVELSFKEQSEAINEVQILAQLKSPFVVRYYDSFIDKDSLHIVMEFCNRGDLQNLIKRAKDKQVSGLKEAVIWNISLQIVLGLHYLHRKKILHRDLKSANVFLMKEEDTNNNISDGDSSSSSSSSSCKKKKTTNSNYSVKIGDLGVAKLMDTSTAFANTIVGTPYYLSPELCADMPYRDKSDCWAMGVLIFECATLQHPFEARNQCALILKIIEAKVKMPAGSAASVSLELRNLILWLLQKDPDTRPSAKDVLCEKVVRERLKEHSFDLPEELINASTTDALRSPSFEHRDQLKKQKSNLQMLAQLSIDEQQQQQQKTAPPKQPITAVGAASDRSKDVPRPQQLDGTTDSAAACPQNNNNNNAMPAGRVLRKGGGGVAVATSHHSADMGGGNSDPPLVTNCLAVAGSGLGPRVNSSGRLQTASHRAGEAIVAQAAAVRGSRVRGPSFQNRAPSEKALTRYQISKQGTALQQSVRDDADSKASLAIAQFSGDKLDDAADASSSKETTPPLDAAGPGPSSSRAKEDAPVPSEAADDYKEDFEEYEEYEEYETAAEASLQEGSPDSKQAGTRIFMEADGGTCKGGHDSPDAQRRTHVGPADTWNPDWTAMMRESAADRGREADSVSSELAAMNVYREDKETSSEYVDTLEPRSSDIAEEDIGPLIDLISEARMRAATSLGESLFRRVYDLCARHMNEVASENVSEDLERLLYEEGSSIDMHVACDAVFSVKLLLALESKYDIYLDSLYNSDSK